MNLGFSFDKYTTILSLILGFIFFISSFIIGATIKLLRFFGSNLHKDRAIL